MRLSDEMNAMTAGLKDRMRMRASLELAMDVQQALLPATDPVVAGLDVAGHSTYCDETGGDYYDFLDVTGADDSTCVVAVGDVMGHGVAAALMMATAQGILRSRSRESGSLADLLTHMNELISAQQTDRFMTMLLLGVDAKRKELRYAAAGHEPPLVYDPHKDEFLDLPRGQMALGVIDGVVYKERMVKDLRPGMVIFAATDGVPESRNAEGELYGFERTKEAIRKLAEYPAEKIRKLLLCQLAIFVGDAKPDDDVTFVVVKVT
jgi:sigma-B regulation protein RsbU (phosphoserine phosphatase)